MDQELTRLFGNSVNFQHTRTFTDNPSKEWMDIELKRLRQLSIDLGIDTKFAVNGNQIAFGFKDLTQNAVFIAQAYGVDTIIGNYVHVETFVNSSELWQKQWIDSAKELLGKKGVNPEITITNNRAEFKFANMLDQAKFTELRDSGQFEPAKSQPAPPLLQSLIEHYLR
jgi:hypothetical protein